MNKPKVSILMNCHNGEKFLKNSIDSIYKQSFKNWEIIFWDNCSTDSSADIAKNYDDRLKYYKAEKKTLLGEARHLALQKCNTEYICFLDCDDEYLPSKLSDQLYFMENSNYVLSCSQSILINEKGRKIFLPKIKIKSGYIFEELLLNYQIDFQSAMIKKSVLEKEKLSFKKNFTNYMDYDLFMRIASKYEIGVIHKPLVYRRIWPNSFSNSAFERVKIENKKTLDDIFSENPELKIGLKNTLLKVDQKFMYYDAIAYLAKNDYSKAKKELKSILTKNLKYFILYMLLLLKINKKFILRILRRS